MRSKVIVRVSLLVGALLASAANGDEPPRVPTPSAAPKPEIGAPIVMTDALVIPACGKSQRAPFRTDAVESALVWQGWTNIATPKDGDEVILPDGATRAWRSATAAPDGWFQGSPSVGGNLAGGWAWWVVPSDIEQVRVLEAAGHGMVFINGEPRAGDPYEFGFVRLPVLLKKGENRFLFRIARGRVKARLVEPPAPGIAVLDADQTTPTLGGAVDAWARDAAVVIMNARPTEANGLTIVAFAPGESEPSAPPSPIGTIPALGVRKVAVALPTLNDGVETAEIALIVRDAAGKDVATGSLRLSRVPPEGTHKATFTSAIDGSTQYFAYRTAAGWPGDNTQKGLILTLHGASVEATNQAAAYARKDWAHIVAPTNRRPYGFDWEDWGRLDAVEVLALAEKSFKPDRERIYLTGHSMGGHGTWTIASFMPEKFAAIGPSAGWISFASYGGPIDWDLSDPVQAMMARAAAPSDTLSRLSNIRKLPTFILHGDADDNVPVAQARQMKEVLKDHPDLQYHEQPGAGHWWGNECVDWPPMMEFFKSKRLAKPDAPAAVPAPALAPAAAPARPAQPWMLSGFRAAFDNRFILVYGTSGLPDDNEWNLAKARYDAEVWWYRGNGSCDIMSDTEFVRTQRESKDDAAWRDRNIIVYGHSESNSAWGVLLQGSPVWATRRGIEVQQHLFGAPDSAALFVRPRPGSGTALVGVIAPTGPESCRLLWAAPYFTSGVHYPEVTILGAEMLENGVNGIRAAGFWNPDWSFNAADFITR